MLREVAYIQELGPHDNVLDEQEIEVTLVDKEQLAHLWPKERLTVIKRQRKVGDLSLILTGVRADRQENQSALVEINLNHEGKITMEDLPDEVA